MISVQDGQNQILRQLTEPTPPEVVAVTRARDRVLADWTRDRWREYGLEQVEIVDESRERFDEAAPMIVNALNTGFIEGDGKFYKQPRIEIRPRPQHSFDGRIYAVASSETTCATRIGTSRAT